MKMLAFFFKVFKNFNKKGQEHTKPDSRLFCVWGSVLWLKWHIHGASNLQWTQVTNTEFGLAIVLEK